ncbi:hypothetical protein BaRGS_00015897 [Batillaria attramentaria]|uniref:Uncharacterized protein n=2 Tax=Batillaria attramentaria TaxID=370345 RepID=A0ABD0L0H9_9CAEN
MCLLSRFLKNRHLLQTPYPNDQRTPRESRSPTLAGSSQSPATARTKMTNAAVKRLTSQSTIPMRDALLRTFDRTVLNLHAQALTTDQTRFLMHRRRSKTAVLCPSDGQTQRRSSASIRKRSVSPSPHRRNTAARTKVKASSSTPDETSSDDVTEYIQPVQEVMVHTDARGRQHQLTVRKVGLRCTSAREANVTIVHEDNVSNSQDAHNETDEEDQGSDQHDGDSNPQESPPSRQNTPRRDSCSQSRSNSIVEDEEAENLALWRRRLAHPHRFSWIPEFAEDKDAQALALAMLAQKRKVGEEADRFKAVVRALAAANHILQKCRQETVTVVEELKHCRYLRMPKEYMAEELKELKWYDIFTS